MRILTTGSNGHLGTNVVRALLKRGYQVVPFVRRGADLRGLDGLGLDYQYGDVLDQRSLITAAQGCDALIHMAAVYRVWAKDPKEIMQPAVEGTRNALTAAKEAGIRRVVYTSSTAAVGVTKDPNQVLTSADWNDDAENPYWVAKTKAEREAWQLADQMGLEMISICPGGLVGAYDYRLTPSTKLISGLINGTAPVYKGGLSYADVGEVAEIHAAAVEAGETGKRYIAAGENCLIEEYGQMVTELTGIKPMRLPGGRNGILLLATLAELGGAITQSEPLISRAFARDIGDRYMFYDSDETYRTFGLTRIPAKQAIENSLRWMLYAGQIKPELTAKLAGKFPPDPSWPAL